jgi:hypothetical protein
MIFQVKGSLHLVDFFIPPLKKRSINLGFGLEQEARVYVCCFGTLVDLTTWNWRVKQEST